MPVTYLTALCIRGFCGTSILQVPKYLLCGDFVAYNDAVKN
ncbi:hypothetical protein [Niabella pedocola]|nr:hypothetical protein [Niabella pedocola]